MIYQTLQRTLPSLTGTLQNSFQMGSSSGREPEMPLAHWDIKEISREDSKSVFVSLVIAIHILRVTTYVITYTLRSLFVPKRKIQQYQQSQALKQPRGTGPFEKELAIGLQHHYSMDAMWYTNLMY